MVKARLPVFAGGVRELRASGLFLITMAAVALVLALSPHPSRSATLPFTAVNARISMNWFFHRPYVSPVSKADDYGIATRPLGVAAGRVLTASAYVRPTGAPGGRVCLALLAAVGRGQPPAQTKRECLPLSAGWTRFERVALQTNAAEFVYAQITVSGNDGGFEGRQLAVVRGAQ